MYVGIDWGQKKIGIAVAQEEVPIAAAHAVFANDAEVFARIAQIVAAHGAHTIVIGKSAHAQHTDNTVAIEQFAERCRSHCGAAVDFAPEMFSSREAQHNLIGSGRKHVGANDDAEAARIILQGYLDAQNAKM